MMNNVVVDEKKYSIGWRFNSSECILSREEVSRIIFFEKKESFLLWDLLFDFENLQEIKIGDRYFEILEEVEIVFFEKKPFIFKNIVEHEKLVFFFWGSTNAAILRSDIFLKSWDDFFYPSDENSIMYLPASNKIIFSFNEKMFLAVLF